MENEKLSLYHIEAGLAELMAAREEELQAIADDAANDGSGLAAIDQAIKEYAAREVAKVDGIRGYLRWAKVQIDAAKAEAKAQEARAKQLQAGVDRLKEFCVSVMTEAGKKRLDGKTGYLMVKGNGGVEPLTITDESLIPNELCWMEGRIRADLWDVILTTFDDGEIWQIAHHADYEFKRVPSNSRIREAMLQRCPPCDGNGVIEADEYLEMSSHECKSCGGTGRAGAPGARLEQRGVHLEAK